MIASLESQNYSLLDHKPETSIDFLDEILSRVQHHKTSAEVLIVHNAKSALVHYLQNTPGCTFTEIQLDGH